MSFLAQSGIQDLQDASLSDRLALWKSGAATTQSFPHSTTDRYPCSNGVHGMAAGLSIQVMLLLRMPSWKQEAFPHSFRHCP